MRVAFKTYSAWLRSSGSNIPTCVVSVTQIGFSAAMLVAGAVDVIQEILRRVQVGVEMEIVNVTVLGQTQREGLRQPSRRT